MQLAMFASHAPDKDGNDVLNIRDTRAVLCRPVFVAADCLLDMIVQTGQQLNELSEVMVTIIPSVMCVLCVIDLFLC